MTVGMKGYLSRLTPRLQEAGIDVQPHITQSNGGTITFETASTLPVRTVLSGPSTGVVGALETGRIVGVDDIITSDMGGTSTDVSLIQNARPETTTEAIVHGYPLKFPMIDIHTVGAGGGSIAYVDSGGFLKVGPRSAGAEPGPICYGLGNEEPTVTDANVVMQILNPRALLGGRMPIDRDPAVRALEKLGDQLGLSTLETAAGIVRVVTANMARAIRLVSVQRGHDPREYCLMPFGGGGPVHAGRLARELGMPRILVPRNPGILCALGLLLTDLRHDLSVTRRMPLEAASLGAIRDAMAKLHDDASIWFEKEDVAEARRRVVSSADMRYAGQNYELNVPVPARATKDGLDGVQVHITNTSNLPVEGLEPEYPLRVERYELVTDSGGCGTWRGGMSFRRKIRALHDECRVNCRGTRAKTSPWGLFGGHDGGRYRIERDEGVAPFEKSVGWLSEGQAIAIVTPGSGGYGPLEDRDPELVRRDLREERISAEVARDVYGISVED